MSHSERRDADDLGGRRYETVVPTVASLSEDLAQIARSIQDMRGSRREQEGAVDIRFQCVELAKMIYYHRRTRGRINPMFGAYEPNWHMALALLIADSTGSALGLGELRRAARLSQSATRRRLLGLATIGIVERTTDGPKSGKATYRLTPDGEGRVMSYLSSVVVLIS